RRPADALRRRIRGDKFRMRGLQLLEFFHHPVKLDIGDFRLIEHVVEILVPADLVAQFFDLFGDGSALYHWASLKRTKRRVSIQCVPLPRNWMPMNSANTVLQESGTNLVSSGVRDAVLIINPSAGGGRRMNQL